MPPRLSIQISTKIRRVRGTEYHLIQQSGKSKSQKSGMIIYYLISVSKLAVDIAKTNMLEHINGRSIERELDMLMWNEEMHSANYLKQYVNDHR